LTHLRGLHMLVSWLQKSERKAFPSWLASKDLLFGSVASGRLENDELAVFSRHCAGSMPSDPPNALRAIGIIMECSFRAGTAPGNCTGRTTLDNTNQYLRAPIKVPHYWRTR
jgi:hypothetical protein